ncbi:MAG: hypothetical protein K0Q72_1942 [Armatimonadetes bacterium]|jgi:hypothetical protein|nr:hypothetical protein [Armatimonadota bacterium]
MIRLKTGSSRSLAAIALALAVLAPGGTAAAARHTHPDGWKVTVRSSPVSKHGMYEIDVQVRDETGNPVRDAVVQLRLHSFRSPGYRLVTARRVEDGWHRTWTRLNEPQDRPGRLRAVVTSVDAN